MSDHDVDNGIQLNKPYADVEKNPLDQVSLTAFCLGIVLGIFLGSLMIIKLKNFNFYIISLCIFHFLEYYITAKYDPSKVNLDSFLLNNGSAYLICHIIAIIETLVEYVYEPDFKAGNESAFSKTVVRLGYLCMFVGQFVRSLAMATAGSSFSHIVQQERQSDHVLVKHGIYSWSRHPSYFGFFYWAVGSQMILLNPVSFVLFSVILWRFFNQRIKVEEAYLIRFFGDEYIQYKSQIPVRIPFIK